MSIEYSFEKRPTADQIIELYENAGLPRPTNDKERIQKMLDHSNLIVTAWDKELLVGVSRCITDWVWACYLSDLAIRQDYKKEGIEFFTNDNDSQQLGYMNRPGGYVIEPHRHNLVAREVHFTQEVLFIRSGKVRVDFYDNQQNYIMSNILEIGDVILLSEGGHGFKMLEKSEMIEVKQGPYCGDEDKLRFSSVDDSNIKM